MTGSGTGTPPEPADVVGFWCEKLGPDAWFTRTDATDRLVVERLAPLYGLAAAGRLDAWAETPQGALALVILFDQVPRNLFRNDARAYATDPRARAVARRALARGDDAAYDEMRRLLLLLPFEHSESLADQEWSLALFAAKIADPVWRDYAGRHHAQIARFGRFPHRNSVLGRPSTPEEQAFLADRAEPF